MQHTCLNTTPNNLFHSSQTVRILVSAVDWRHVPLCRQCYACVTLQSYVDQLSVIELNSHNSSLLYFVQLNAGGVAGDWAAVVSLIELRMLKPCEDSHKHAFSTKHAFFTKYQLTVTNLVSYFKRRPQTCKLKHEGSVMQTEVPYNAFIMYVAFPAGSCAT